MICNIYLTSAVVSDGFCRVARLAQSTAHAARIRMQRESTHHVPVAGARGLSATVVSF